MNSNHIPNEHEVKKQLAARGLDTSFLASIPSGAIDMRTRQSEHKVPLRLQCPHCNATCASNVAMTHDDNCKDKGFF